MATSAFKSTTRRASLANSPGDSSSSCHRRARSLSRFSRRIPGVGDDDDEPTPAPRSRGRFVNTVRGSGFPEISLDDLAVELFDSSLRGRSVSRMDDVTPRNGKGGGGESVGQRRGRSVSRQGSRGSVVNSGAEGRFTSDTASSRRRRSVSVVGYQISDSESDLDLLQNPSNPASMKSSIGGNNQLSSTHKPTASNNRQGLRRSLSQKDLKYHDGYSSHSSSVTDDEGRDAALSNKNGAERTIKAVYAQKKGDHPIGDDVNGGLYAAMRKELRHAVEEIKTQLEQSMGKTKNSGIANVDTLQPDNSDVSQAISTARRKCTTKLEKSEKRRQDLLAEILLEEQHGRELSKIVKELLTEPKSSIVEKPGRARKRSNDRYRMSRQLTEEAEKYIEDFISNVEDTDISSLDGDRSDTTSSSIGGITKTPIFENPAVFKSVPVEMDGVLLPWLQWETSNDVSPLSCENKRNISQETVSGQDLSDQLTNSSSRGSWSPEFSDCTPLQNVAFGSGNYQRQTSSSSNKMMMKLDLDDYINSGSDEDFLLEMWSQRPGINSATSLFKLLFKYMPEEKAAKKERLSKKARAEAEGNSAESKKPIVVKYGLNHVTDLEPEDHRHFSLLKSGLLILTTHRLIWLPSSSASTPTSASAIPLAAISHIFSSKKSLKSVFHSPRIRFQVLVSSDGRVFDPGSGSGSSSCSGSRSVVVTAVIRGKGDCDGFLVKFWDSWRARAWETTETSGSGSAPASGSGAATGTGGGLYSSDGSVRMVGVAGILRKEQEMWESTDKSLQDAFQDLNALMSKAKEMVMLAEKMRQKLLSGMSSQTSGTNDEDMGSKEEMQDWLLSVGIISPVTKESAGALYHQQLSRQLADFVRIPLERAGGMINLIDAYCLFNRARGTELISPDDMLQACSLWEKFDVPVMLRKFDSGVMVIQNKSHSDEEVFARIKSLVTKPEALRTGISPSDAAMTLGIAPTMAKEHLLTAESKGLLCRDISPDGFRFYINLFPEIDPCNMYFVKDYGICSAWIKAVSTSG